MANTTIQLKRSGTTANAPAALSFGEIALNYADGKLYYKNATGQIVSFSSGAGADSFGSVNANGTIIVAATSGDILTLIPGSGIAIAGDAIAETITISSTGGTGGGGYYDGNRGSQNPGNYGDIFRIHSNTLSTNVTIYSGNNAICAGPLTIATGQTLTIQTGARSAIV